VNGNLQQVDIRIATEADLVGLLRLYTQLSASNDGTPRGQATLALDAMLRREGVTLLVATEGERLVGTVTLVIVPNLTHRATPWAQLENMVVDDVARGTHVGRMLIEECVRLARIAGCYKVQLQSGNERREPPNDAHGFYRHMGFAESAVGFRQYLE